MSSKKIKATIGFAVFAVLLTFGHVSFLLNPYVFASLYFIYFISSESGLNETDTKFYLKTIVIFLCLQLIYSAYELSRTKQSIESSCDLYERQDSKAGTLCAEIRGHIGI